MLVNVKCALLSIGFDDATFVCRKSVSNPTRSLTIWRVNFVVFNGKNSYNCISLSGHPFTCRFILEPKSVLLNEQEQKFNESESAIASMQVSLIFISVSYESLKSQDKANLDSSFVLVYPMIRLRRNILRNSWERWRTTSESCFNRTRGLHARFSRWLSNESCLRCICIWSGVILQFDLSANSAFPLPYCELRVVFCCNGPFHVWTKEFAVASCNSFSLLTDAEANCSCRGLTCCLDHVFWCGNQELHLLTAGNLYVFLGELKNSTAPILCVK